MNKLALILCWSIPDSHRPKKSIPSLKSPLGPSPRGSGALRSLMEQDRPKGRPEQVWMMYLFGSLVTNTRETWKTSLYPFMIGRSMMDLPLVWCTVLHLQPLVRKLWWSEVLQGGFAHLTARKWETALLPEYCPDFSIHVCGLDGEMFSGRLDLTPLEGVCLSVSVRGIIIGQCFR